MRLSKFFFFLLSSWDVVVLRIEDDIFIFIGISASLTSLNSIFQFFFDLDMNLGYDFWF